MFPRPTVNNKDWNSLHIGYLCTVARNFKRYQISRSYFCKIVRCVCKRLAVPSVSEIATPDDWKRLMDSIVGLAGSVEQNKLWFSTWNKSSDRLADKSSGLQRLIEFLHRTNCSGANRYISAKPSLKTCNDVLCLFLGTFYIEEVREKCPFW